MIKFYLYNSQYAIETKANFRDALIRHQLI